MMPDLWSSGIIGSRPSRSAPCSPIKPIVRTRSDSFHIAHKVPVGDTPYVRAKRVQLVDKDPQKAIALFWAAINAGDRVDSALKDMAIVMKQQNRAEEAVEAIKSLRSRCSDQAQESLDNILLDLYKRCGRLDDQIALLKHKLHRILRGLAFNGKRTKTARSHGRKFQVSVEQEATRLLGNLGWALMQQDNYVEAEAAYRRALILGPDNNKMCNLGVCLMKQGKVAEAKETLRRVRPAVADGPGGADSHLKAFERAQEMLRDLEFIKMGSIAADGPGAQRWPPPEIFSGSSSSVWHPQPCVDFARSEDLFGDENVDVNKMATRSFAKPELSSSTSLNVAAPPFYCKMVKKPEEGEAPKLQDPLHGNLKRTRSGTAMENPTRATKEQSEKPVKASKGPVEEPKRRSSPPADKAGNKWLELLPDSNAFDEAIVAAVLAPVLEAAEATADASSRSPALCERKVGKKRLRVFEDITVCMSPKGGS